ncbi:MAG: 50S ribosomal protein L32 [Candidatus Moranbacteria bacterium]|nr:50S ribosomal protein L32 [Candidatus Moranbacteria bacterium]
MPVPKQKQAKSRSRRRRSHQSIKDQNLIQCSNCLRSKPNHRVCPSCGYYKARQVIKV